MAGKGRESFEKRQRERAREERAKAKAARKQERRETDAEVETPDEDALFEQFRRLSERHDAGEISDESFEERRQEIFSALNIDVD